ncbi:MAG: sulfatase [Candidatus Hydrogenedentes bacterium]|nr:sulfatase [Candidatus Hydrogenedentota bacterium]
MDKVRYTLLVVFLGMGQIGCFQPAAPLPLPDAPPADHVLLIIVDTLRADHLPTYGYSRETAPFLDELSRQATVFTRAISTSTYTPEAVSSLFTGCFPSATPWGAGWYARPDPGRTTLAPHFQASGYRTALFSATPMLLSPEYLRGFEKVQCYSQFGLSGEGPRLVMEALEWLQAHAQEKTFLYLHFLDPHAPFDPPAAYRSQFTQATEKSLGWLEEVRPKLPQLIKEGFGPGEARFESIVADYDAEIRFIDDSVKDLFSGMEAIGIKSKTLAVIAADHGEEFLEHGFMEHGWRIYPETVHIPLIFWRPGAVPAGRIDTFVSIADIFPSLAQLQGLTMPREAIDGRPLYVRDTQRRWAPAPESRVLISELIVPSRSVVRTVLDPPWFYIASPRWLTPEECSAISVSQRTIRSEMLAGTRPQIDTWLPPVYEALYNLEIDPGAQNDVLAAETSRHALMKQHLEDYRLRCPMQLSDTYKATLHDALANSGAASGAPEPTAEGGASVHEELKSLGYL